MESREDDKSPGEPADVWDNSDRRLNSPSTLPPVDKKAVLMQKLPARRGRQPLQLRPVV
jgi:hypothetical protein